MERACDPRTAAPYVAFIFIIAGCEAFATSLPAAEGDASTPLATPGVAEQAASEAARANLGVRALDDRTLRIELSIRPGISRPLPRFRSSRPCQRKWSRRTRTGGGATRPTGSSNGPFQVSVMDRDLPNPRVHFVPNAHYWGFADAQPQLQEIIYRYFDSDDESLAAYLRGELEVSRVPYPYGGQPEIAQTRNCVRSCCGIPAANTIGFGMNAKVEPFQDKQVREAFAYGLDREAFCREVWSTPASRPKAGFQQVCPGTRDPDAFAYNPDKARQALAASSYGGAEHLPEISYRYGGDDIEGKAIAEWLAANYRTSLGIEIALLPTTDEEWDALEEAGTVARWTGGTGGRTMPIPRTG